MNSTINEKAEKIKKNINTTAEKSKEAIKEIIKSNTKYIDSALDNNKEIVDLITKNLKQQGLENDDNITATLKKTFGKSIELSEESIDSIINAYTKQTELNIDFNTKLIDTIKELQNQRADKALQIIQEYADASRQLAINNTKEIVDSYNKHTNLALNFNKQFGEHINSQINNMSKVQDNMFSSWTSEWWKDKKTTV
jgi:histidinol dehydrogenase